jgi:ribosome recycling factor
VPPLTEDRRRDLVKQAKVETENGKISIRNIRQKANDEIKKLGKDGLSEDLGRGAEENIQELTNTYSSKVDVIFTSKEAEIMTV